MRIFAGSRCINTAGSYTCSMSCEAGYFLVTTINGGDVCSGKIIIILLQPFYCHIIQM